MPLKRTAPEINSFLVIWWENNSPHWQEYVGYKNAVDGYRYLRQLHGDNCRIAKVVVDYGVEV